MRFSAEHRFSGPPDAVAAVLADPGFYEALQLPDLSLPEILGHRRDDGGTAVVALRYEYTGHLDPLARRLLGGGRLAWTQEIRIEPSGQGRLTFGAEANPAMLHGDASFVLSAEGSGTVRRLEGEIVVAVPVIGGMAEGRIVPGVLARLDIECAAVNRRLGAGRS